MMTRFAGLTTLILVLVASLTWADVGIPIEVGDNEGGVDFRKIQLAIEAAENGDTILVYPGSYEEVLNFNGKQITVTSTDPCVPGDYVIHYDLDSDHRALVTFGSGEGTDTVFEGFTLMVNPDPNQSQRQDGILCYYSSPTLRNLNIYASLSYIKSTGIRGEWESYPEPVIESCYVDNFWDGIGIQGCHGVIQDCEITNNGGGLVDCDAEIINTTVSYNQFDGIIGSLDATIQGCVISQNGMVGADETGYGITQSSGTIEDTDIYQNEKAGMSWFVGSVTGSDIFLNGEEGLFGCSGDLADCVVSDNGSDGVACHSGSATNCLVAGNGQFGFSNSEGGDCSGPAGGFIENCTVVENYGGVQNWIGDIKNNIIAINTSYGVSNSPDAILSYNNVWGNPSGHYEGQTVPGTHDIHKDPEFVDTTNYQLKSTIGHWTASGWVADALHSPCIDAGDPEDGIGDEPLPSGYRINMGFYGGTAKASQSNLQPECAEFPAADIDGDCRVNMVDFSLLIGEWLECNLVPVDACFE